MGFSITDLSPISWGSKLAGGLAGGAVDNIFGKTPSLRPVSEETKKAASRQVDAKSLEEQYKEEAFRASQQQLAQTNALIASQKGTNPALAAMQMGNLQSQAAQNLAGQEAMGVANIDYETQLKNIGLSQNLYSLEQGGNIASMQGELGGRGQNMQLIGGGMQAAGSLLSMLMMSDERLKEPPEARFASGFHKFHKGEDADEDFHSMFDNVEGYNKRELPDIGKDNPQIKEFLNSLNPKEFQYKEGSIADDGGKTHAGVLAQDVEKSKLGKDAVRDVGGYKALDVPSLVSLLTAGIGNINERLNSIEGRKNG